MQKQRTILMVSIFSSFICFLWLIGLGITLYDLLLRETSISQPNDDKNIIEQITGIDPESHYIVALGDSLTRGTGDANGKGYIGYVVDYLQANSTHEVQLQNLAVNGYRSEQLVELMKQNEVQRQIKMATTIFLTIGGNDLFQGGQTLSALDETRIQNLEDEYLKNLQTILSSIRELNSEAPIIMAGLYNPFIDLAEAQTTSKVVLKWNHQTQSELMSFENTLFVPTFDLFQHHVKKLLSSDQFHPNRLGYERIAERMVGHFSLVGENDE